MLSWQPYFSYTNLACVRDTVFQKNFQDLAFILHRSITPTTPKARDLEYQLLVLLPPPPKVDEGYVFTLVRLSVCLFVCLSVSSFVCLRAGYLKMLQTDLNETW